MTIQNSPLNTSDSDFINLPEPVDESTTETEDTTTEATESTVSSTEKEETSTTEDTSPETESSTSSESESSEENEGENKEEVEKASPLSSKEFDNSDTEDVDSGKKATKPAKKAKDSDTSKDVDTTDTEASTKDADSEATTEINYKDEYEKLLAPFKANGKNIRIKSVDDALSLMKMGANYNKKMAALKPNLTLMKMLENNDLLDESKLSYLIDLDKKNPAAVQKFIKDSGVDPLDIDIEKDTDYTPSTYTVNDKEVELDGVLDDIRETDSFAKTIDIIGTKWDASSKKVLIETPAIIKVINDQVANGIFDKITDVVESERMLGRLQGLSDLEAYRQVGEAIQARGGFNTTSNETDSVNENTSTTSTKKSQDDPKLKDRKRAASTTRSAPGGTKKDADYNPLALSDADFEKVSSNDFI